MVIRRRSLYRWLTHQCIFWGVVLSCLITFPLTFGWLRFTQVPSGLYELWVAGFPLLVFNPSSPFGFAIFHALDGTAILLLVGLVLAFHRRFHDLAVIAVQRFRFDMIALALLAAIAVSGLALTADSAFLGGAYYWYLSLVHEAVVVLWLISLPFGKFFHILERPATVGIELYWRTGEDSEQRTCPRCGMATAIPTAPNGPRRCHARSPTQTIRPCLFRCAPTVSGSPSPSHRALPGAWRSCRARCTSSECSWFCSSG